MTETSQSSANDPSSLVISYLKLRLAIGFLGVAFPIILVLGDIILAGNGIQKSLSFYYHTVMRDVFVGVLFVIGALLFSYRGYCWVDDLVSHLGCFFAIGIAVFPALPDRTLPDISPMANLCDKLHLITAALFFGTLIYFCLVLFPKSDERKPYRKRKRARNCVYRMCGYTMSACIVVLGFYFIFLCGKYPVVEKCHPTFWLETLALWAFGFSWLTKGQAILKDHTE